MSYALFHNGQQIGKAHSTKRAAEIEAYERFVVIDYCADFIGDRSGRCLADGYEIKETPNADK